MFLQVKCWQVRNYIKASQVVGAIHTNLERGFICVEVILQHLFLCLCRYHVISVENVWLSHLKEFHELKYTLVCMMPNFIQHIKFPCYGRRYVEEHPTWKLPISLQPWRHAFN